MKKMLCLLIALLIAAIGLWAAPAATSEGMAEKCPDLAVCGGLVWRVDEMAVLCEDVEAGEVRAALPLSTLTGPGETPFRASVAAWTDESVLLALAVRDAANHSSIRLIALGLTEGGIAPTRALNGSEALAFLADDSEWYEVNLVGCGRRLFIAAMDSACQFHFFRYDPDVDALLPLGERPLAAYTAALFDGDGVIIAGPSESDAGLLALTRLSLEGGDMEPLDAIALDSALRAANFAWDASRGLLYYTQNNTVFALSPGRGESPTAVGMLADAPAELRRGAVVGNRFVALSESGQLLSCDIQAPVAPAVQLRIAEVAGDGCAVEAARDFGVAHPGWSASVADAVGEAEARAAIESRSPEYDAYVLTLNSGLYQAFRDADAMADLSADTALASAVDDMTPRMAEAIRSADGRLLAMPLAVGSSCQCLNVPALEALTGLSREELPTDWAGFLALLGQLADSGALNGGEYRLYDGGLPAEGLREMLFSWMLQDCLLWVQADASAVDRLLQALVPVARAFDETDWSRLAAPEEIAPGASDVGSGGIQPVPDGDASKALLTDGMLDIAVAPQVEGMELWPLSIQPGGARLIGQAASVICVSPWSAHPEAALAFTAHAWERANVETRMSLCQSMNAPVANDAYQADLAYMAEDAAMLRQAIPAAQSAAEAAWLQGELDRLEAYQADYRENGRWLASAESIARYRGYADALVPTAPYFDYEGPVGALMLQFLDGAITPEQFAERLAGAVR